MDGTTFYALSVLAIRLHQPGLWKTKGENRCYCSRPRGWVRHENGLTSVFKYKFYKDPGPPNLATIAKFDEIVKIGGCTWLGTQYRIVEQ